MTRIGSILNLPTHYFTRPVHQVEPNAVYFRSLSSATKTARTRAARRLEWTREIVTYLREFVQFPSVNIPDFELPRDPARITGQDIERLADETRRYWKMGNAPISNVVWLLENNGAVVVRDDLGADTLDALSTFVHSDRTPYIILGAGKGVAARSRFDAAHELGHILLHRNVDRVRFSLPADFKLMEMQAHRFAGAFLLPAKAFLEEYYAPKLDLFRALKPKWKVSIAMMIMRGDHLGLMEPESKQKVWMNYSRRGWRTEEPYDNELEVEQPRLLRRSIELLLNQRVQSKETILSRVHLSITDVEEITGLPSGSFDDVPLDVRVLKMKMPTRQDLGKSQTRLADVVSIRKTSDKETG